MPFLKPVVEFCGTVTRPKTEGSKLEWDNKIIPILCVALNNTLNRGPKFSCVDIKCLHFTSIL